MLARLISQLITLLMLVSIYMFIRSASQKKKKQMLIWGILFLLPVIFLIVLVIIYGEKA
ncbi:MAG: hypothetical protein IJM55_05195 [Ruminococcus sp.]|jgi:t-SNARE complex subunit (syntaxin)|nr:hypothetical protein [Ruminococcus sp.]